MIAGERTDFKDGKVIGAHLKAHANYLEPWENLTFLKQERRTMLYCKKEDRTQGEGKKE